MAKIGETVRDHITGFKGIVVARTEHLYGCVQLGIKPLDLKDGLPQDVVWMDEQRVDNESIATAGGPQPTPPARGL